MNKINILITGAASGIGNAAINYFADRGHSVYAVDITKVAKREGVVSFVADITDEQSLYDVRSALEKDNVKLDVILCVAGVHTMASLVESDYQKIKKLIDVNLLGTMLTNRVLHALLSERGRILIVTSEVATYLPMPFNGLYNVSKTALDCYAQALRQELNLLGQKVVTIRPGAVNTPLASSSADTTVQLAQSTKLYEREAKHFSSLVSKFTGKPMSPAVFAKTLYKAATVKRPRLSYNKHRNIGLVLLNLLPASVQCAIIKMLLHRK